MFRSRLAQRHRHFMKAAMLESQLATLEVPADAVIIDAALSPPEQVEQIRAALAL
jgi:gluconokinase